MTIVGGDDLHNDVSDLETDAGEEEREVWGSKWEFIFSCVGLSVGIGRLITTTTTTSIIIVFVQEMFGDFLPLPMAMGVGRSSSATSPSSSSSASPCTTWSWPSGSSPSEALLPSGACVPWAGALVLPSASSPSSSPSTTMSSWPTASTTSSPHSLPQCPGATVPQREMAGEYRATYKINAIICMFSGELMET